MPLGDFFVICGPWAIAYKKLIAFESSTKKEQIQKRLYSQFLSSQRDFSTDNAKILLNV